jgi:WD40 repeat protein
VSALDHAPLMLSEVMNMADTPPQLHVPCTRVSAPAICTRRALCSIAWVSPQRLVTRDLYGHTILWSLDAQTCVQRQEQPRSGACALISPDRLIFAASGYVDLWCVDPAQDHLSYKLTPAQRFSHERSIQVSAGIVVAAQDDAMLVLRLEDDRLTELHRWPGLAELLDTSLSARYDMNTCSLSADASTLASTFNPQGRVVSLHDGVVHLIADCQRLLALDATGQRALVRSGAQLRVVSLPDDMSLHSISSHSRAELAQFIGDALVFVDGDATLCLYDLTTSAVRWRRTFDAPIKHLACSPDGRHIALGFTHRVLILDAQTGELAQDGGPQGEISRLACVERAAQIVASPKRTIWYSPIAAHRWSTLDGAYLGALDLQFEAVQADALHGQAPIDLLHDTRASIVRWPAADAASAKVTLPDTPRVYTDIAITQDGRFLVRDAVIMNPKGTKATGWGVYLLDLQQTPPTDTLLFSVKKSPSWPALYASASRYAALACDKDTVEVFDLAAQPLYTLKGAGKGGASHIAFSPDEGSLIAACGAKIKRWSLVDGEPVWESKHLKHNPEHTVCVTPDGQHVASAGRFHAWITLRSMQTGAIVAQLHQDAVEGFTALTFGPDDRLYAAGIDTQLYAIDLPADL